MFLRLWNYLRGYVMIEVSGFSVERFMNMAAHKGIYLWDVNKKGAGVTMKVSLKGFWLLRACSKKTKCRVRILKKAGYPFAAKRYGKRKFYAAGLLFFVAALYALSSFVWLVEIEGFARVPETELLRFCEENGLRAGILKRRVDEKGLEQSIMNEFSDISWCTIQIKGTKATLKLTETVPKVEMIDKTTPCNVVARKDGVVTDIVTVAGTPKVKMKDVVQKGDILVSSELVAKEDEMDIIKGYTHAQAEVEAKSWEEMNFAVPYAYTRKQPSENKKRRFGVALMGKSFMLYKPGITFENFDKDTKTKQLRLNEDYVLPIALVTETYTENLVTRQQRTPEETAALAEKMITNRITREFDPDAQVVDKQAAVTQLEDGLLVKAVITVIERIDEQVPLKFTNDGSSTNDESGEQRPAAAPTEQPANPQ